MTRTTISDEYFEWIYDKVCGDRFPRNVSYRKLLMFLHDTEFIFFIPRDANRAEDGIGLRYRFAYDTGCACADSYLDGPCSVLEMTLALAIRCEEDIMDDPEVGDRTGQWFWGMITNLGLGSMHDARFDRRHTEEIVTRFLKRNYEPNGEGGLFTIKRCPYDLRDVEIWRQLCWYLDSIT